MFALGLRSIIIPELIEINCNDLSYKNTSWSYITSRRQNDPYDRNITIADIFYYPKLNLLILQSDVYFRIAFLLNISTDPYSNYTYCGPNGMMNNNPSFIIYSSPYDCPNDGYRDKLGILLFDENQKLMYTLQL